MMSSEPGAPTKFKIKEDLETDVWDRWNLDITKETPMAQVLSELQTKYKLMCRDIIFGSIPVFMYALRDRNIPLMKQTQLVKSVKELLSQYGDEEEL